MGEEIHVSAEDPGFAMVPYWVLFKASGNAVKLYGILRKYANNETGVAYPSRATLARDMGFKDPKSLTPLVAELETMGAIQVNRRKLDRFVNHYRVLHNKPSSGQTQPAPQHVGEVGEDSPPPSEQPKQTKVGEDSPEVGEDIPPGVGEDSPLKRDPSLTRPNELNPGDGASAAPAGELAIPGLPPTTEVARRSDQGQIADWVFDEIKAGLPRMAIFKMAQTPLDQGYTAREVALAMRSVWRMDRSLNGQTLARYLQGITRQPGQPQPSVTEERVGSALGRAAQYRAAKADAQ